MITAITDLNIFYQRTKGVPPKMYSFMFSKKRATLFRKLAFRYHLKDISNPKAFAIDCTIDEAKDTQLEVPFKKRRPEKIESTRNMLIKFLLLL